MPEASAAMYASAVFCKEVWVSGCKPTVLKTVCPQGHVGSNPTTSAKFAQLVWEVKRHLYTVNYVGSSPTLRTILPL